MTQATPPVESTDRQTELPPRPAGRRIGPFSVRQLALINLVVGLTAIGLFIVTRPLGDPGASAPADPSGTFYRITSETQGLDIGQQAPELQGTNEGVRVQLTDLKGRTVSLAELRGRPVWINFWATWCPPCQKETPDLREAYNAHVKDGLVLLAISVQEVPDTVAEYRSRYELDYTIGLDTFGAIMKTYRVFGLPTHYFLDREGVIRARHFGPLDRSQIDERLALIIGQPGAPTSSPSPTR